MKQLTEDSSPKYTSSSYQKNKQPNQKVDRTADLSAETLQARKKWQDIFKVLKGKNLQPRLLYPARTHSELMEK